MQKNTTLKERTYFYSLNVIKFIDTLRNRDLSTQVIARQLLRSGTSVGANVAEAQAGSSKKDFTNFYNHSLKSANESAFWLKLLLDSGKANKEVLEPLLQETIELANILASSIIKLRDSK